MRTSWIFLTVVTVSILLVAALRLPTLLSNDEGNEASMSAPTVFRRLIPSLESNLGPNIPPSIREASPILRAATPTTRTTGAIEYRTPRGFKIIDPEDQYLPASSRVRTTGAPRLPGPAASASDFQCPSPSPVTDQPSTSTAVPNPAVPAPPESPTVRSRPTILTEGAIYTTIVGSQEIGSITVVTDPLTGRPVVTLSMTRTGARNLYTFSRDAVGETITLVLDGQVLVSPIVASPVSAKAVIRGLDDEGYARLLKQLTPLCP